MAHALVVDVKKPLLLLRTVEPGPAQHQVLAVVDEVLTYCVRRLPEGVVLLNPLPVLVVAEPGGIPERIFVEVVHPELFEIPHLLRDGGLEIFHVPLELLGVLPAHGHLCFGYRFSHVTIIQYFPRGVNILHFKLQYGIMIFSKPPAPLVPPRHRMVCGPSVIPGVFALRD